MIARSDNTELRTILEPAYKCVNFSGVCKACRWEPGKGFVPRSFGGAIATLDMVRLVLVSSEPGNPGDDERYEEASASDMTSAAMDYHVGYLKRPGSLRRNRRTERYTENMRTILDLCWPELHNLRKQLERTWLTASVKCSAPSGGEFGSAIEEVCVDTYLKKELALFPHAFVIALGGKAKKRLRGSGVHFCAFAMSPSARPRNNPEETWREAARAFRRWLKDAE